MERDEFYQRVRRAAQAGQAFRVAPVDPTAFSSGYVGGGDDLCQRFAEELRAVGGFAQVVSSLEEMRESARQFFAPFRGRRAIRWEHPLLTQWAVDDLLAEFQIDIWSYSRLKTLSLSEQRRTMLSADLGITSATHAIAETGSLVMASGPGTERSASLLPPVHLALVKKSQILPDLFDLFTAMESRGIDRIESNVTLITGPSKTGDIELHLTTGVHGPGKLQVLIGDWE